VTVNSPTLNCPCFSGGPGGGRGRRGELRSLSRGCRRLLFCSLGLLLRCFQCAIALGQVCLDLTQLSLKRLDLLLDRLDLRF
jgi:hypothetical protein